MPGASLSKVSCEAPLVAEVQFAVVADVEIDFAEGLAGAGELLHGELGKLVVYGLVPKSAAVVVAGEPEVVSVALVVEVGQVGLALAAELRAFDPRADERFDREVGGAVVAVKRGAGVVAGCPE